MNSKATIEESNQGGFRVKIPKKISIVSSISDYVENDGKLGFYQVPEN